MIVLITLLACAAIALRGHIPGAGDTVEHRWVPSAIAVALMPVLFTVSVVILLAGVIASRHRLPLSMPDVDDDPTGPSKPGRTLEIVLGVLAVLALLAAAAVAVYTIGLRGGNETSPPPARTAPALTPVPGGSEPTDPGTATDGLSGLPLLLTGVAAVALIAVALAGLVVVALAARRTPRREAQPVPAAPAVVVDSLTRAAEMGLAAMNAPGQDPRTAIIACYVAMERGLASDRAAAPLASDTPMEVLARAFERGALHDASARELVSLFEEARFSPHSMMEWQRMRAEQLLRIVLADLQGARA
ncbi:MULTISPECIES: DUF4129 domain-containing protein [Nocardia]|uniref:DUF4129 domain-containing protein n=1 Tax=Nocardia TaxID=1817 RepID=UPI000D69E751|nr:MULTISPECIES: DUF4129 domain-containing protein [Nocardia]